jgi:hypothetical protein
MYCRVRWFLEGPRARFALVASYMYGHRRRVVEEDADTRKAQRATSQSRPRMSLRLEHNGVVVLADELGVGVTANKPNGSRLLRLKVAGGMEGPRAWVVLPKPGGEAG